MYAAEQGRGQAEQRCDARGPPCGPLAVKWLLELVRMSVKQSGATQPATVAELERLRREVGRLETELADERRRGAEVERRYRGLVDRLDAIFWEADADTFEFTYVSPRAESITGYPMERWMGEPGFWVKILHPEDRDWVVRCCAEATAAGRDNDFEYRMVAADGRVLWLRDLVYVERDDQGRPRMLRGVMLDITAHKQVEEALRASGRAKDQFLAMLAHELRNPLGAVSNALQVMRESRPGEPPWERALGVVERQVRHQGELLDDLLEVSRLTRGVTGGYPELRSERLDFGKLVAEAVEDSRAGIEQRGLALALVRPGEPLPVEGDPVQLTQVLLNLLHNAAKFTAAGGRIEVRVAREGEGRVAATVRDTGMGIEPELLPRVFDAFSQADQSLDRTRGGLGLGLALVKGWVELHGGEVRAESAGAGQGASFTVVLPLAGGAGGGAEEAGAAVAGSGGTTATAAAGPGTRNPAAPPAPGPQNPAAPPEPGGAFRVLVIEDNFDAAETLCDLLELFGYRAEMATSGPEGVEAVRRLRPDVVLCDIGLPGMDGYEVARELRRDPALAGLRLVSLTGYGGDADRREAKAAGFDLHLVKPIEPTALQRLLEQWAAEDRG
jgi:PAS domain S-box-containing protein